MPIRLSSRTINILFLMIGEISMAFSCDMKREEVRKEIVNGKLGGERKFWDFAITLI
jgi:hypothetical protein